MLRTLILFLLSFPVFAIDLVIDGKTYYIEKYEITDNGKRIVIPYTIHLDEKAYDQNAICQRELARQRQVNGSDNNSGSSKSQRFRSKSPARSISSVQPISGSGNASGSVRESSTPGGNSRRVSDYQKLLNSVDGGYKKLLKSFKKRGRKPYKRNLR